MKLWGGSPHIRYIFFFLSFSSLFSSFFISLCCFLVSTMKEPEIFHQEPIFIGFLKLEHVNPTSLPLLFCFLLIKHLKTHPYSLRQLFPLFSYYFPLGISNILLITLAASPHHPKFCCYGGSRPETTHNILCGYLILKSNQS